MFKRNIIRWSFYIVEIILFHLLESTPDLLPQMNGVRPTLLISTALSVAMFEGDLGGLSVGIVCGFFIDNNGAFPIGFHSLLLAVLCYLVGWLTMQLIHTNIVTCLLTGIVFFGILCILQWLFGFVIYGYPSAVYALSKHYFPRILYTYFTLPIIYFINRFIALRFAETT